MSQFAETEVGTRWETKARTITEADVVNFAGISGDFNHLHTDAERMAASGFGERIAHGALVFAIYTGLLWQSRTDEEQAAVVAFYGVDHLRFVKPVFIGDTIHVEVEVTDTEPRDHPEGNGVVRYEATVVNQHDEVVLVCEPLILMK